MRAFLSDCQRVENLAAAIYDRLARDSDYPAWLCEVFRNLAAEEWEHAQHIDMVSQGADEALDASPGISGDVVDATLRSAREIADQLDRGRVSEEQALRIAIRMEEQFMLVHVRSAVLSQDPRIVALFESLRAADDVHKERLRGCLKRWQAEHTANPG